jgi:hypothetical protein
MTKYTRSEILDTAKKYVTKERANVHGDMKTNLTAIAKLWSVYLDTDIKPHDIGVMMNLLKIARIKFNPENADNWVDACGYMALSGELSAEKPEPEIPVVKFQGGNV